VWVAVVLCVVRWMGRASLEWRSDEAVVQNTRTEDGMMNTAGRTKRPKMRDSKKKKKSTRHQMIR